MLETSVTVNKSVQGWVQKNMAVIEGLPAAMSAAVRTSALNVANGAKNLSPVATGALSRSIIPTFFKNGLIAVIGSALPYAPRQEFDASLQHNPPKTQQHMITRGPNKGRLTHPTNTNPAATWGFLRKSLAAEKDNFLYKMQSIMDKFK